MFYFLAVVGFVLGGLIGSFLNVVIYRVPRKLSIVSPPSACPHCDHRIAWYDNVPVLSWLILRGRCRHCSGRISPRYPLIELGTAIAFALIVIARYDTIESSQNGAELASAALVIVALLYLAAISIALAAIDLERSVLPNAIVLPAYVVGAVLLLGASILVGDWDAVVRALIGAAALFVFYLVLALVYPGGMGFGDVKLAGVLGLYLAWLGWSALVVGAFAAFVLGGIVGLIIVVARRGSGKTRIPFGPWMIVGAWVGILWGAALASSYLRLFGLGGSS